MSALTKKSGRLFPSPSTTDVNPVPFLLDEVDEIASSMTNSANVGLVMGFLMLSQSRFAIEATAIYS